MARDILNEIEEVSAMQVQAWLEKGEVLLVDVRETSEYEAEFIAGALLLPLSSLDPDYFPVLPGQRVVLHCAIGKRSAAAAKMLLKAGHVGISHMSGGLTAWKDLGLETEVPIEEPIASAPIAAVAHPGRVLVDEFLSPQKVSPHALAQAAGLSEALVSKIIAGMASINSDTSLRLAQYFSTEPGFWMHLQVDYDMCRAAMAVEAGASTGTVYRDITIAS